MNIKMTDMDIVRENEWLIKKIAKKFYNVSYEDLYQAGVMGLMNALRNYHNDGTTKFSTYAYQYIFGEMYQSVYKNQSIKISKDILRAYQKIEMARSALSQRLHKIPNNMEVAEYLGMDVMNVEQVVASGSFLLMSLDDEERFGDRSYYETIECPENLSLDDKIILQDGIKTLSNEEQKILEYRYFEDMTQSETAEKLHMTQVMVSRYEKKGIQKMRSYYNIGV